MLAFWAFKEKVQCHSLSDLFEDDENIVGSPSDLSLSPSSAGSSCALLQPSFWTKISLIRFSLSRSWSPLPIAMIVSNIIIFSTLVPHFHFHPPMSCFCLNHLLLWRLSSWWLSYWIFQELFAFTVFKISHSLWHVYHLSFINEIFPFCQALSFVHLRWVTKGGSNHCHHHLNVDVDVEIRLSDMKDKALKNSI